MSVRDMISWGRNNQTPSVYNDNDRDPFLSLHRQVNRLFDDVMRGFDRPFSGFGSGLARTNSWPSVEIADNDKELKVIAEVPGLDRKDIEILIDGNILTLRGEKRSESEDKEKRFSERYYGRFERRIPLGYEIAEDKITASFADGVLTVICRNPTRHKRRSGALKSTVETYHFSGGPMALLLLFSASAARRPTHAELTNFTEISYLSAPANALQRTINVD